MEIARPEHPAPDNPTEQRRRSIARALAAFNPTLRRVGRVQRQAKRCLTIHNPASMTQLKQWCYAGRAHAHWQYEVIREALHRLGAVQIGRANSPGRPAIYCDAKPVENCNAVTSVAKMSKQRK